MEKPHYIAILTKNLFTALRIQCSDVGVKCMMEQNDGNQVQKNMAD